MITFIYEKLNLLKKNNMEYYTKTIEDFKKVNFINLSVENKILKINEIIKSFPNERKIDICENCRYKNGDYKQYNNFLQDTKICSICFETSDLLNYSILELVEKSGLTADEFYNYVNEKNVTYNGLRCSNSYLEMEIKKDEIFNNGENFMKELEMLKKKYPSALSVFVYDREQNFRQNFKRYFERCKKLYPKDIREKNSELFMIEYQLLIDKYY